MDEFLIFSGIILITIAYILWNQKNQQEYDASDLYKQLAHDIVKPIKTIKENLNGISVGDRDKEPLSIAKSSLEYLNHLSRNNSILSLSEENIERKKLTDITDLCRKVIKDFQVITEQENINLQLAAADSSPKIWGNEEQLTRMIYNLIDNAIKYRNEKNPNKNVIVKVVPIKGKIQLSVSDNGWGIQNTEYLFKPLSTRQAHTMHIDGTGVGLKLVYDVVRKHKGKIDVQSTPKIFSTFTIELPLPNSWQRRQLSKQD